MKMTNLDAALSEAIKAFWQTRSKQHKNQGKKSGRRDAGDRAAVTGGKHADGICVLVRDILVHHGVPDVDVHCSAKRLRTLPGFYRPSKEWDLVAVCNNRILAALEVKSQVGSFGNNFNNRVEESIGNAIDFWQAHDGGTFLNTRKPWLGYLFILESHAKSTRPRKAPVLPHYSVRNEFASGSYATHYALLMEKLVERGLYSAACLITTSRESGLRGEYGEPSEELSFKIFAQSLAKAAETFARA